MRALDSLLGARKHRRTDVNTNQTARRPYFLDEERKVQASSASNFYNVVSWFEV